jgi:hypothetical protein
LNDEFQDVAVVQTATLDEQHRQQFNQPWLVQFADGMTLQYPTEDVACAFQRLWRANHGRDRMTAEPL